MRSFLRNVALGLPLALGAMLTLFGVTMLFQGGSRSIPGVVCGLIGVPVLFAALVQISRD